MNFFLFPPVNSPPPAVRWRGDLSVRDDFSIKDTLFVGYIKFEVSLKVSILREGSSRTVPCGAWDHSCYLWSQKLLEHVLLNVVAHVTFHISISPSVVLVHMTQPDHVISYYTAWLVCVLWWLSFCWCNNMVWCLIRDHMTGLPYWFITWGGAPLIRELVYLCPPPPPKGGWISVHWCHALTEGGRLEGVGLATGSSIAQLGADQRNMIFNKWLYWFPGRYDSHLLCIFANSDTTSSWGGVWHVAHTHHIHVHVHVYVQHV